METVGPPGRVTPAADTPDVPRWGADGLLPVVVQDSEPPGGVLMLAWSNAEALQRTLDGGEAWFWSRSRNALWRKGDTSGNVIAVRAVLLDCDGDALVYVGRSAGPACHTGARRCFYRRVVRGTDGAIHLEDTPEHPAGDPGARGGEGILTRLAAEIEARSALPPGTAAAERSYVNRLLRGAPAATTAKIVEEAGELARALAGEEPAAVAHEAADLLFHVLVGLAGRGVALEEVLGELGRRFGVGGLAEKEGRPR